MIQLAISEPRIEKFFNYSKDEILKALEFMVENDINGFKSSQVDTQLTVDQKKELNSRLESFHKNRNIGNSWNDIKSKLVR